MKNKLVVTSLVVFTVLFGMLNVKVSAQSSILGVEDDNSESTFDPFSCTTKSTVDGFVFVDNNNDKKMQNGEEAIQNMPVTILYTDSSGEKTLLTVQTDRTGKWTSELCPGTYTIKFDPSKLSSDKKAAGDVSQVVSVKANASTNNINFTAAPIQTAVNPLIILGGLLLIVALIGGIFLLTRKQNNNQ